MSPYGAEEKRKRRGMERAQILFLDEGNDCRSIMGSAILRTLLQKSSFHDEVTVSSASIGPAGHTSNSAELFLVLEEMGLELREGEVVPTGKVFDQESDPIDHDLLLVMDRFDREEVYKDVSVLDTINPNGYYTSRLKLLGEFCRTLRFDCDLLDVMEISDPWYGTATTAERSKSLKMTVRKLLMGCEGLVMYLSMLKRRSMHGLSLQTALTQSLRCPVMENSSLTRAARMHSWKPVWKSKGATSSRFYTLRDMGGELCVVRKHMLPRKTNKYWLDIVNVESELRNWMRKHKSLSRLPKHRELKATGHFSLSRAIVHHGGISRFVPRLRVPCYAKRRKPKGYWEDIQNVEEELREWMHQYESEKLPTRQRLRETGHNALATAFRKHGGVEALTRRLGVEAEQRGRHFWKDDENFRNELLPQLKQVTLLICSLLCEKRGVKDEEGNRYLPTQQELLKASRGDLLGAILRRGGLSKVAKEFGCACRKRYMK